MLSRIITIQILFVSLCFSAAFAAPVNEPVEAGLVARAGDGGDPGTSRNNPKNAELDISNWEDVSEEDCYAILCLEGGERTWQRVGVSDLRRKHYQASGAEAVPFRKDQVSQRHTEQINSTPGETTETNSAEEFPWESMTQGGSGAFLLPATRAQQHQQGNSIRDAFRNGGIKLGDWFKITFKGKKLGKFCKALQQDPPDTSVCNNPEDDLFGKKKVNLNNFVWQMSKIGGKLVYHHAAGSSKGKTGKRMSAIEMRTLQAEGHDLVSTREEDFNNNEIAPTEAGDADLEDAKLTDEDWEIIKP